MKISVCQFVALLFPMLGTLLCHAGTNPPNPLARGPHPVGVTTTVLVDTGRSDNVTKKFRTLVTEIWYPATDDAFFLPKNRYSDFFPGGITPQVEKLLQQAYKRPSFEIDAVFWNYAVRDARVREGKFPCLSG